MPLSNGRTRAILGLVVDSFLVSLAFSSVAEAQVGRRPEQSPYEDLRARQTVSVLAGYMAGSSGKIGVGPANGMLVGLRYDFHTGGPVNLAVTGSFADLERLAVNPLNGPRNRAVGPVRQTVLMGDFGVNLLITGQRTWRRLLPYIGASIGLAFGGSVPADSSAYRFSVKVQVGPQVGIRWFPSDRLHLRVEGRNALWLLKYPSSFFREPDRAPGADPVLDPLQDSDNEWTHHPMLMIGLGYAFKF